MNQSNLTVRAVKPTRECIAFAGTWRIGRVSGTLLAAVLVTITCACGPVVGDTCERDTDCGTDLRCDLSTPDGYCTLSPCRTGECPVEAVCIDFGAEATFCMRTCGDGEECREGLTCRDDIGDTPFCGVGP